jgi:hypothetical protein
VNHSFILRVSFNENMTKTECSEKFSDQSLKNTAKGAKLGQTGSAA